MTTVSKDDAGVTRGTVFQEVRPGAGFKNGESVTEKLGGATVERLLTGQCFKA